MYSEAKREIPEGSIEIQTLFIGFLQNFETSLRGAIHYLYADS